MRVRVHVHKRRIRSMFTAQAQQSRMLSQSSHRHARAGEYSLDDQL